MLVVIATVYPKLLQHLASKRSFWQHEPHRFIHCEFRLFLKKRTIAGFLNSARITAVVVILFLVKLSSCKHHFVCVDNYYKIARIYMRQYISAYAFREVWLQPVTLDGLIPYRQRPQRTIYALRFHPLPYMSSWLSSINLCYLAAWPCMLHCFRG